MKKNPGRKERRALEFHGKKPTGHGKPQTYVSIGKMKPTISVKNKPLTSKRIEMLKKYPWRALPSEKEAQIGSKD